MELVNTKSSASLKYSTKIVVVPPAVFKIDVEEHGQYDVEVATNSTIRDVKFSGHDKKVSVTVEGKTGTKGVTQIHVPKSLVSGNMMIMIDGKVVADEQAIVTSETDTHTSFEVNYHHSVHTIDVVGTNAVPEFGSLTMLVLGATIISALVIGAKSRIGSIP